MISTLATHALQLFGLVRVRATLTCLLTIGFGYHATADVLFVPDDYATPEEAVNASSAGDSIVLRPGTYWISDPGIRIEHALQIVGEDGAVLGWSDNVTDDAAVLTIDTGPDENVVLSNLTIDGGEEFTCFLAHAVSVEQVGTLFVDECAITGGTSVVLDFDSPCAFSGGHGISVGGSADAVVVAKSEITGGKGFCLDYDDTVWGPGGDYEAGDGGHGIVVPGGTTLVVTDSIVRGGDGGFASWTCMGGSGPPDSMTGGDGGDGVVGDAYVSNSLFAGGLGGTATIQSCGGGGTEQDGMDGTSQDGTSVLLGDHLHLTDFGLGETVTVTLSGLRPNGRALLLLGFDVIDPVSFRGEHWFLLPPVLIFGPWPLDGSGGTQITTTLDSDLALTGLALVLQAFDGDTLAEPEMTVIEYR